LFPGKIELLMYTAATPKATARFDSPKNQMPRIADPARVRRRVLAWYDRHRRRLPWRAEPGETADPYRVWLSEIMLQQTTVAAVTPYFEAFIGRWPRVADLAKANLDEVLHQWQGLGYYARARNLHACARAVVADHGGRFPDTEEGLRTLPGIGAYTAAAVAAIAFGQPATPVDGNVVRVMARLYAVDDPLPAGRAAAERHAGKVADGRRPGDLAQGLMDLGATVCTPRRPRCSACPLAEDCAAAAAGRPEDYPRRARRRPKPDRHGVAFWVRRDDGAVLLRRRPERGLLGGMIEIPSTDWRDSPWGWAEALGAAPLAASWQRPGHAVTHTFTHFHLRLEVATARVAGGDGVDGFWWPEDRLGEQALPTLMRKVAAAAAQTAERSPGGERLRRRTGPKR